MIRYFCTHIIYHAFLSLSHFLYFYSILWPCIISYLYLYFMQHSSNYAYISPKEHSMIVKNITQFETIYDLPKLCLIHITSLVMKGLKKGRNNASAYSIQAIPSSQPKWENGTQLG